MLNIYFTKLITDSDYALNSSFSHYWLHRVSDAKSDKRKAEILTSAVLIKKALKDLNINEADVTYDKAIDGKPYFSNIENLYYNLSHSGDYVVLAMSDTNVGIDIQKIEPKIKNVAKRFFTDEENQYLNSLDGEERIFAFYKIWSVKESYIKYTGRGLRQELSSFNVSLNDDYASIKNEDLILTLINEIPNYSICVCHKSCRPDYFISYEHQPD